MPKRTHTGKKHIEYQSAGYRRYVLEGPVGDHQDSAARDAISARALRNAVFITSPLSYEKDPVGHSTGSILLDDHRKINP
jgi:hypothetical protein